MLLIVVADPRSPEQVILALVLVIVGCAMLWKRRPLQVYSDRLYPFASGLLRRTLITILAVMLIAVGILAMASSIIAMARL